MGTVNVENIGQYTSLTSYLGRLEEKLKELIKLSKYKDVAVFHKSHPISMEQVWVDKHHMDQENFKSETRGKTSYNIEKEYGVTKITLDAALILETPINECNQKIEETKQKLKDLEN